LLHALAEGIWTCELDQINSDPNGNWYRLARKKIYQQIVNCSECQNKTTRGRQEVRRLKEELDKDDVCHKFCSTSKANILAWKLLKGLETSKLGDKKFTLPILSCDIHVVLDTVRWYRIVQSIHN